MIAPAVLGLAALALAAVALAPLAFFVWRGGRLRGRQEAAIALHRAQLVELDRDLAEGRLLTAEHEAAKLEVQRRLLADAALPDAAALGAGRGFVLVTVVLIPLAATGLYLTSGHPGFPPPDTALPPRAGGLAPAIDPARHAQDEALIAQLRNRLAVMDPHAAQTLKGYEVLGNAELSAGHLPEAASAWQHVLNDRFDPTLAAETAEVLTQASDHVTMEALTLFKRALAQAPADAPWRSMAEKRVAEAGG